MIKILNKLNIFLNYRKKTKEMISLQKNKFGYFMIGWKTKDKYLPLWIASAICRIFKNFYE